MWEISTGCLVGKGILKLRCCINTRAIPSVYRGWSKTRTAGFRLPQKDIFLCFLIQLYTSMNLSQNNGKAFLSLLTSFVHFTFYIQIYISSNVTKHIMKSQYFTNLQKSRFTLYSYINLNCLFRKETFKSHSTVKVRNTHSAFWPIHHTFMQFTFHHTPLCQQMSRETANISFLLNLLYDWLISAQRI